MDLEEIFEEILEFFGGCMGCIIKLIIGVFILGLAIGLIVWLV
ncbi:MAG: hypothetical protein UIG52_07255 [Bacteroidales bacterium]|nr:hypothetical protein [Bacteroidales bacterium]